MLILLPSPHGETRLLRSATQPGLLLSRRPRRRRRLKKRRRRRLLRSVLLIVRSMFLFLIICSFLSACARTCRGRPTDFEAADEGWQGRAIDSLASLFIFCCYEICLRSLHTQAYMYGLGMQRYYAVVHWTASAAIQQAIRVYLGIRCFTPLRASMHEQSFELLRLPIINSVNSVS